LPTFQTRHHVPYTPRQMFDLVADVEQYPHFLPMCESLSVRSREVGEDHTVLVARMSVGYKAIQESFTSRVTLHPADPKVLVEYLDGPFRYMQNRWLFRPVKGGCEIDFWIDYEFRSRMLGMLMGALFDKAFRRFAIAFEERAAVVYGRPTGLPLASTT